MMKTLHKNLTSLSTYKNQRIALAATALAMTLVGVPTYAQDIDWTKYMQPVGEIITTDASQPKLVVLEDINQQLSMTIAGRYGAQGALSQHADNFYIQQNDNGTYYIRSLQDQNGSNDISKAASNYLSAIFGGSFTAANQSELYTDRGQYADHPQLGIELVEGTNNQYRIYSEIPHVTDITIIGGNPELIYEEEPVDASNPEGEKTKVLKREVWTQQFKINNQTYRWVRTNYVGVRVEEKFYLAYHHYRWRGRRDRAVDRGECGSHA